MTKIINWKTKETIIEDSDLSIKELVEKANKDNISLSYANLRNANLCGVNLGGIKLRNTN